MTVTLDRVAKRFNRDWIFRDLSYTFSVGIRYAILGPNGSGKSTLLKAISGYLTINEGRVVYRLGQEEIPREEIYQHVAYTAPYMELPEELTVSEVVDFQAAFKPFRTDTKEAVVAIASLEEHANKQIRDLSSGMRQRLKVTMAVLSNAPILLLDEPATNLDEKGLAWMKELVEQHSLDRVTLIASNRPDEYAGCQEFLDILSAKPSAAQNA
jgi:ABC-type multidrug transport system ATPase subunit